LSEKKFIEITTPKINGSASEGGANLFSLDYFGIQHREVHHKPLFGNERPAERTCGWTFNSPTSPEPEKCLA